MAATPRAGDELLIGVRLRAGCARAVIGERLHTLAGRTVALSDLNLARLVQPSVLDSASSLSGLLRLGALIASMPHRAAIDLVALEAALQLSAGVSIGDVCSSLAVSDRTLRRRCDQEIGLAPKQLATLGRFRRALIARGAGRGWAQVALDAGYADQSHLARDFRRLTARTPSALLRTVAGSFKTGHVEDDTFPVK